MAHRVLLSGCVALAIAAMTAGASAQPFAGAEAARAIRDAGALAARIRAYHYGPGSWRGGPPPLSYCGTLRAGEAALQELARLANAAIFYQQPGLALSLEHAADRLSDALDQEIEINQESGIPYVDYPCPAATAATRAFALAAVDRKAPTCSRLADIRALSFNARRTFMPVCFRS